MMFSELYSAYYNTVAKIITKAFQDDITEKELQRCVLEEAFSESVLTIWPSLKSGKWPLLHKDLSPVLDGEPTMPLTTLEKRWLKAIAEDPRVKLFGVSFPELNDIEPLFTSEDYKIYDQYGDGDPFEDEQYILHFRVLLAAIKEGKPVKICTINRNGKELWIRFYPKGLEYSVKDDKFRVLADGCKFHQFNLGRMKSCEIYRGQSDWTERPFPEHQRELVLEITDERNTLERAMLHFAHFEKQTERVGENKYVLHMKYNESDETEIVIRVLSFGPCVKVLAPQKFVELIKRRLISQKSCEL